MTIMITKISIIVFLCACFISIYQMLYGLHCGRQVHCGRQGQKRRTRPGRRLTWPLARFFQNLQKWSKSVQKCPRVVQIHISSVFLPLPIFWITFGPLLDTFGKKQAKGHVSLLPGLVLLVALAVHSALACHSVVRTASDRYLWNRHTRTL